jgi:glutamate synthase (NADPH) small chain
VGIARFANVVRGVQTALPEMAMIGGGYSWLRQFLPALAAANVRKKAVTLVGLGRMAFAYPDAVRDLMRTGKLDPRKVCIACSACTQIMRDGGRSGCVPRDATVYAPIYKAGRRAAVDIVQNLARECRQCNDPTCVEHCPTHVNIPKFIGYLAEGHFREAYETIRETNILTATCGYVCPSEVQCESGCVNQHYSAPVPIRQLQQWIGRKAMDEGWVSAVRPSENLQRPKVAVIGAGPAGVAAAAALSQQGYHVTLMDKNTESGGGAADLIPANRLPEDVLRKELLGIIQSYPDRIHLQQAALSPECTVDRLFQDGYQAILLALGLSQAAVLPGARRPVAGVYGATDFLTRVKCSPELTPQTHSSVTGHESNAGSESLRVRGSALVLGGGNTAIDAATSALKAGAREVSLVYRRTFAEMPAWPQDRDQALHAGVNILTLTAPVDYVTDAQGRLIGLKVMRTRLGSPDSRGRRAPLPLPGTEHVIPADLVIEAFGQEMDADVQRALKSIRLTDEGLVWLQPGSMQTSRPGVFAAGDLVNGGATVAQAVAEGTWAARDIDRFLRSAA